MAKHSAAAQKMRKIKIDRFSRLEKDLSNRAPIYQYESIEEYLARGGKITKLKSKAHK